MKNPLSEIGYLRLYYSDFEPFKYLIDAYDKADVSIFPGVTGNKVHRLRPIKEKFLSKYTEAKEIQLKFCETLEEHFDGHYKSVGGAFGTTTLDINHYRPDVEVVVELTMEEFLVLFYYVDLFKDQRLQSKLDFKGKHRLLDNLDNIIRAIIKSFLWKFPGDVVFME
jgi:hypothetical protein